VWQQHVQAWYQDSGHRQRIGSSHRQRVGEEVQVGRQFSGTVAGRGEAQLQALRQAKELRTTRPTEPGSTVPISEAR